MMTGFTHEARTRIIREAGALKRLPEEIAGRRAMLVADPAIPAAIGLGLPAFRDFGANPTTADAERGRAVAAEINPEVIVALGGGSSLDCAKAINFLLTNGGTMHDYWGYGKAHRPLLPMIGIPTTTGTGSEAQSYCLVSDAVTHRKMACGDPSAAFGAVLLDPVIALTQPRAVRAASGFDALIHAVETWVTTARTDFSDLCAREAWRLLSSHFDAALDRPHDLDPIAAMQWGAFLAGWAIEHSMLGATHACANPLTARYGTTHGHALAVLAPHVVAFNAHPRYAELAADLPARLREWAQKAGMPATLRELGAASDHLPELAEAAAEQWTGRFNPRPFDKDAALEIYRCAF